MIYSEMTKKALKLCFEAHKNQTDKSGMPYVFHPFHLAESMTDEYTTTVALLHDVVEDTDYTLRDLKEMGFPERVTDALALLTHNKSVPYMEYVEKRLKKEEIAKAYNVKEEKIDIYDEEDMRIGNRKLLLWKQRWWRRKYRLYFRWLHRIIVTCINTLCETENYLKRSLMCS